MPTVERISYVTDACVLLDLDKGRILRRCLRSRIILKTTDLVVEEELIDPNGEEVLGWGLREIEIPGDRILQVTQLQVDFPELSVPDASTVVLSQMHNSILLTKDGLLKHVAGKNKVETRSTLWLMDQLITLGILAPERAQTALNRMELEGRILNRTEVSHYRTKWQEICDSA